MREPTNESPPAAAAPGDPRSDATPTSDSPSNETLTAVDGFQVGHWTDAEARTGCTVVLCPEGAIASGRVLGGAPAGREQALLAPHRTVAGPQAVLLAGGSAFGLAAADGVSRWLEARGRGFPTRVGPVPIVTAACIYDLEVGSSAVRPDAAAGSAAAAAADANGAAPVATGAVGVAAGASAGAYLGYERAFPTGLGSAALRFEGATLAALAVANPAGDIHDPASGELVRGHGWPAERIAPLLLGYRPRENTTLVVVATDAALDKAELEALSVSAHIGIARVTRPSHTPFDGDTTFAVSSGRGPRLPLGPLAVLVQELVARAILRGARSVPPPPG